MQDKEPARDAPVFLCPQSPSALIFFSILQFIKPEARSSSLDLLTGRGRCFSCPSVH
jgi:hypothetical protein